MDRESLITGYFENTLSEEELLAFNQLLAEDDGLAEDVDFRRTLQKAIKREEKQKLKRTLQAFEQERKGKRIKLIRWSSAAAVVILVSFFSLWIQHRNNSPEYIYNEYYATFPNMVKPLVRGKQPGDDELLAFRHYDSKNYEEAARLFSREMNTEGRFYEALSKMELGRHSEAMLIFNTMDLSETQFKPYILWYQALNLIYLDQKHEALEIIKQLESYEDFDLAVKVKELRKKLD